MKRNYYPKYVLFFFLMTMYAHVELLSQSDSGFTVDSSYINSSKTNPTGAYLLEDVVITGQYSPQKAVNAIHPVRIIGQRKIQNMAAVNLADVLTNELNIRLSQDQVLGRSLSLQGLSGQNVKILIDGVPIIGRQNGNLDITQLNLLEIERIEIVEGPLSVNYGTNALAGTINLITKKASNHPLKLQLNTYLENIGTFNQTGAFSLSSGNHYLSLSGGRNFFDGWSNEDDFWPRFSRQLADSSRFQSWKPREQYFGRVQYRWNLNGWELGLRTEFFDEEIVNKGLPRVPYQESAFDDTYLTSRLDQSISANGKINEEHSLNLIASYNFYRRRKNTFIKDLTTLEETLSRTPGAQDTSEFNLWMSRGSFISKPFTKLSYELGYDVNWEEAKGLRIEGNEQKYGDFALFTTAEISPLDKISLRPGLRYAYNTAYNAPLVPSFNAKFDLGAFTLRTSYARGFRAPTLKELYFFFVDINHNIIGNNNLLAETSHNYNLNLNYRRLLQRHLVELEGSIFYNDIDELITLAQINEVEFSYVNVGIFRTLGYRLSGKVQADKWQFQLGTALTGRYNQLSESMAVSDYSYYSEVNGNLSYEWSRLRLWVNLFYKYQGQLPGFALNQESELVETLIEDYHLADATIRHTFWHNKISLSVGAKNIFDVRSVGASGSSGGVHSGGASLVPVSTGRILFSKIDLRFNK